MSKLLDLIKERFGRLTEIQRIAIPKILRGEHVIIMAPTGYGKTEAALLPALEKIDRSKKGFQVLWITPLRSLNRDMLKRFSWWCDRLDISYDVRHGDTSKGDRERQSKNPPHLLITTPETLNILLVSKNLRENLRNVRFVIVDEVHDILDNKRGAQLSLALERLEEIAKFQRIAISATVSDEELCARLIFGFRSYSLCEVGKKRTLDISVFSWKMKEEERLKKIKELSEKNRSLIFANTRSTAEELGGKLKKMGAPIEVHHGSLSKDVRIEAEDKFKRGEIKSLLATSSLELGIDIGDVNLVIQYSSPHQVFRLIQRVGRSGHGIKKTPRGMIFTIDLDDYAESLVLSTLAKNGWIENQKPELGALDVIAHQVVGLLLEKGALSIDDIHKIFKRSFAYGITKDKLLKIILQLQSQGFLYLSDDYMARLRRGSGVHNYYFSNVSTIPKEKKYLMRNSLDNRIIARLDERFVSVLEEDMVFLSKGQPWRVVSIDEAIIVEPTDSVDVAVPEWIGEDIPVDFFVAQETARLRKKIDRSAPGENEFLIEVHDDLLIIHAAFGNKVNETLSRFFSYNLSRALREKVQSVCDAYRIMIKLPFSVDDKLLKKMVFEGDLKSRLIDSLWDTFLLRLKFKHVAYRFGFISEDSRISIKLMKYMRNSVIFEETINEIFFRYFDIQKAEEVLNSLKKGKISFKIWRPKEISKFANIGLLRLGKRESVGIFEPTEQLVKGLKEDVFSKVVELNCLSCGASFFLHLGGDREVKCPRCGSKSLYPSRSRDKELAAALVGNYGKKALWALSVYGIGERTAERILKKLHRDEKSFWLDILEEKRRFLKNKKFWKR